MNKPLYNLVPTFIIGVRGCISSCTVSSCCFLNNWMAPTVRCREPFITWSTALLFVWGRLLFVHGKESLVTTVYSCVKSPQKSWGVQISPLNYCSLLRIHAWTICILFGPHTVCPHELQNKPCTHHGETVSDVHYGIFPVEHDACADSGYQALFSADEKEPGVEANAFCTPSLWITLISRCAFCWKFTMMNPTKVYDKWLTHTHTCTPIHLP